ncbi:MAG: hypothetical protein Q3976_00505 [Corynebacterium sp.]|nr:hypothetical protein [Corynebacterium sp.]
MNTTGTASTSSSPLEDYSALIGGVGVLIAIALFIAAFWGSKKFDLKLGWLWALGVALLPLPVLAFWVVAVADAISNKNAAAPAKPEFSGAGLPPVNGPQGHPPFGMSGSGSNQPKPGEFPGSPGPQGSQGPGFAPFGGPQQGAPGHSETQAQPFAPAQPFSPQGQPGPQGPQGPGFAPFGGEDQSKPPTGQFAAQPFAPAQPFEPQGLGQSQAPQGASFEQAQPFAPAQPFEPQGLGQSQAPQGASFEQAQSFAPAQPFEPQGSAQPIFPNQTPHGPSFQGAQSARPEPTGTWGPGHFTYPAANPQSAGSTEEAGAEKKQE